MKLLANTIRSKYIVKKILCKLLILTHRIWNDEFYIKSLFSFCGGQYRLNLKNPKTFNEKLNWNKLHDHNPIYHDMVDKYNAKKMVADIIGEQYIVPCYGIWNNPDEIDMKALPESFVLKATHDSSGVYICKNKSEVKKTDVISHFKGWRNTHYNIAREWAYKDVMPRIIADMYIDDKSGHELTDYKFWCFNGIPQLMYITNKGKNVTENFYDMNFNPVMINHGFKRKQPEFKKPQEFELMKSLCVKLLQSTRPSFVRVDFFNVENRVYFGEFTFYDWGGIRPFSSYELDLQLGSLFNHDSKM